MSGAKTVLHGLRRIRDAHEFSFGAEAVANALRKLREDPREILQNSIV